MTSDLPAAATPEHLTDVLRRHGVLSAGRVASVTTKLLHNMAASGSRIVRLTLAYDGLAETAPASLILKTWTLRPGVPEAWSAREVVFYDTVAPATPTGLLLRCFDSGQSPETNAWHLLLEDVSDTHQVATQWPLPPTEPQCRAIVGVLARFHAAWWDTKEAESDAAMARDLRQSWPGFLANFVDTLGDRLSADRRRILECSLSKPPQAARLATHKNLSIVHGDAHTWNVFVPKDGSPVGERLFDWATWRISLPATDLTCMMAMPWYPELRQRIERPLLDHYHASLLSAGVNGYDRAALDHDYRLAVLMQMWTPILWANIGIPAGLWWNNFERIMMAVDDLDCRELLA